MNMIFKLFLNESSDTVPWCIYFRCSGPFGGSNFPGYPLEDNYVGLFTAMGSGRAWLETMIRLPTNVKNGLAAPLAMLPNALAMIGRKCDVNVIVSSHPYGFILGADAWVKIK